MVASVLNPTYVTTHATQKPARLIDFDLEDLQIDYLDYLSSARVSSKASYERLPCYWTRSFIAAGFRSLLCT